VLCNAEASNLGLQSRRFNPMRSAAPLLSAIRPVAALNIDDHRRSRCLKVEVELTVTILSDEGRSAAVGISSSSPRNNNSPFDEVGQLTDVALPRTLSQHSITCLGIDLIYLCIRRDSFETK
jgi:hypothetical protein